MNTPRLKPLEFFSNTVRAKEIIVVLAQRGFGEMVRSLGLPKTWVSAMVDRETVSQGVWARLRQTLEDLGPTFVKFGQVLCSRPDLLPEAAVMELKKLRSSVRPVPFTEIAPVLLAELPGPLEEIFSHFESVPAASGSMAQVHRARLAATGEEVAVKIQRPGIRAAIRADIEIIGWLAKKVQENVEELRAYDLPEIVKVTAEGMFQELDFTIEAQNAQLFNHLNPYGDTLFAPKVYAEFTTPRLTVTEWVTGRSPGDPTIDAELGRKLARVGGESLFHQIVLAGFFHGDPHSGNLLVTGDGRGCLLDWGLAGQLTREMRYSLADLFAGIVQGDAESVCRTATMMAESKARIDRTRLEKEVSFVLRRYRSRFEAGQALGKVTIDLLYVFGNNGIKLARDYGLLAKAIVCIEEVSHLLDPAFDIRTVAEPSLKRLNRERYSPQNVLEQSWWGLVQNFHRVRDLPQDFQRFLRQLEDGEIQVHMRHEGLEKASDEFSSGVNRLALSLLTGALVVGSSIIMATTVSRDATAVQLLQLPAVLGTVGYLLSAILGILTAIDILRHGRRK